MDTKLQSVLAISFMKLYISFISNEELTKHKAIQNRLIWFSKLKCFQHNNVLHYMYIIYCVHPFATCITLEQD